MKLSKIFAVLFGILGILIMIATIALCIMNRNAEPKLSALPPEAAAASQALMDALSGGDYATAQSVLYGEPDLGLSADSGSETGKQVWSAFQESFTYSFTGGCYIDSGNICRDVTVTTMDIPAFTAALPDLAKSLLAKRIEAAEDLSTIYDANNNYLPQVMDSVMEEASAQALASAGTVSYDVKLKLLQRDGRWWVIPDKALLKAISGGLA